MKAFYRIAYTYPGARRRTQQGHTWFDRSQPVNGLLPAQQDLPNALLAAAAILRRGGTVAVQRSTTGKAPWVATYSGVDAQDASVFEYLAEYFTRRLAGQAPEVR